MEAHAVDTPSAGASTESPAAAAAGEDVQGGAKVKGCAAVVATAAAEVSALEECACAVESAPCAGNAGEASSVAAALSGDASPLVLCVDDDAAVEEEVTACGNASFGTSVDMYTMIKHTLEDEGEFIEMVTDALKTAREVTQGTSSCLGCPNACTNDAVKGNDAAAPVDDDKGKADGMDEWSSDDEEMPGPNVSLQDDMNAFTDLKESVEAPQSHSEPSKDAQRGSIDVLSRNSPDSRTLLCQKPRVSVTLDDEGQLHMRYRTVTEAVIRSAWGGPKPQRELFPRSHSSLEGARTASLPLQENCCSRSRPSSSQNEEGVTGQKQQLQVTRKGEISMRSHGLGTGKAKLPNLPQIPEFSASKVLQKTCKSVLPRALPTKGAGDAKEQPRGCAYTLTSTTARRDGPAIGTHRLEEIRDCMHSPMSSTASKPTTPIPRFWGFGLKSAPYMKCHSHVQCSPHCSCESQRTPKSLSPTPTEEAGKQVAFSSAALSSAPNDLNALWPLSLSPCRSSNVSSSAAHTKQRRVSRVSPRPSLPFADFKSSIAERKPSCVLPAHVLVGDSLDERRSFLERIQDIIEDVHTGYMQGEDEDICLDA